MAKLIIGCGYLGRRVAALWRAAGHTVYATTRRSEGADELRHLSLEPVLCDVLDPGALPSVDTVLYAVGFDRTSAATMRDVYVTGLSRVLDRLPPPGRFIHVSSSSVYGQSDGSWVDETSPTEPEEASGQIVLAAETVLRGRSPTTVILRFAGIYGPSRWLRRQTIERGEPIVGDAEKWLNLIHVDDGATAVLAAETNAEPGRIYNICDDGPVRRREFYTELARVLHAPSPQFVPPSSDQPPPHEKGNRRIGNRRLREELGVELKFPTFRDGLRVV